MAKKLRWEKSIVYHPKKLIRYVGTSPGLGGKYVIQKHGIKHYRIEFFKLFWGTTPIPAHFDVGTGKTLKESKEVANNHYKKRVKHGKKN